MEKTIKPKSLIYNTVMMYLLSIAKLIIPLISLPYLTRVLSVDCYGSVSFVKSVISYLQIVIDFGFLLSATKDIINLIKNKQDINKCIGDTVYAQLILTLIAFAILIVCCFTFDILREYTLFTILYFISIALSAFMFEYVFKAVEQMDKVAVKYILMKLVSLVLTIIFVKSDSDVLLIPIFEILSALVAVILVAFQLKKLNIKVSFSFKRLKQALKQLKDSFIYFISNFATTAFSLLNTLLIGLFLSKADVAYWSLALQLITAVHALYNPITTAAYPRMIKEKNLKIIHRIMLIYMPLILCGCGLILLLGDWAITLVFTKEYLTTSILLKCMIPLLIFSFPSLLYGWPCLGAINKQKQTTMSTIIAAVVQVVSLIFLALIGHFNIITIAIVRNLSEVTLCLIRMCICYKNKKLFIKEKEEQEI